MEVYALVGPSGTGKSHRATVLAHQLEVQAIIDDGLLILGNRIIAGSSAKRQETRIGAIKSALFMDNHQAEEIKDKITMLGINRLLILGTSVGMTERIAVRLDLPLPVRVINISDIASEKEIRKAKFLRARFSKHVIPAPTLEVRKTFPGTLVDPLQVFLRKKGFSDKKDWIEKSVVRPTFTLNGKLTISNSALTSIIRHAASSIEGVGSSGKIQIVTEQEGIITINIAPTFIFGYHLHNLASTVQYVIKESVEGMTGLNVKKVNVQVKSLQHSRPN